MAVPDTLQHGPMESVVRELAYIGETDGLLMAARRHDAIRAELLAALIAFARSRPIGGELGGITHLAVDDAVLFQADAAIAKARGQQ